MSDASGPSGHDAAPRVHAADRLQRRGLYVPHYLESTDSADGTGAPAVPSTPRPPGPRSDGIPVAEPPASESFRAQQGNQFYVTGSVNGNSVRFLVDTGATYVC